MSFHGEVFDLTIIGAGPVGLYGAIYAGSRGLKVKIIESQPIAGGRLSTHYPDKVIYDVAGHPAVRAQELVNRLLKQSEQYKPEFCFNQKVESLTKDENDIWSLFTPSGEHRSKAVLIAAGISAFLPGKLDLPVKEELEGKQIFYDIEKLEKFKDKKVVVIGTGDHALAWSLKLTTVAENVTLVHRLNRLAAPGDTFQIPEEISLMLKFPFFELKEIHGEENLEAVTIINTNTGAEETLETDILVLNVGFVANLNTFKDWGLAVSQNAIHASERMETNLPGVYVAGDIVTHPGKIKLISTGAGEAAAAVNAASKYLNHIQLETKRRQAGVQRVQSGDFIFSGYEAVQISILLEQEALSFYRAAFDNTNSQRIKDVFARMQRTKHDNINYLKQEVRDLFKESEYAQEDLDNTAAAYLASASAQHVFSGYDLAKETLKNSTTDLQNIYTGIQVENDLKSFLQKLSQEKKLASASNQFIRLSEKKDQELQLLRELQANLMETGLTE